MALEQQFLDTDAGRVQVNLASIGGGRTIASVAGGAEEYIGQIEAVGDTQETALGELQRLINERVEKLTVLRMEQHRRDK